MISRVWTVLKGGGRHATAHALNGATLLVVEDNRQPLGVVHRD